MLPSTFELLVPLSDPPARSTQERWNEAGLIWPTRIRVLIVEARAIPHPNDFALLSSREREKFACFRDPVRAARFCGARAALRRALADRMNCSPENVLLQETAQGKPYAPLHSNLFFSISYDGSFAFIALCMGREIGLDVQRLTPKRLETVRHFILKAPGSEKSAENPAQFWTRMEAYGKMVGTGLSAGLLFLRDVALERAHVAIPHQFLEGEVNGAALTVCAAGKGNAISQTSKILTILKIRGIEKMAASSSKKSTPLQRLVLTEEGFVFNPQNGRTFTVNETGLFLLRLLQEQASTPVMVRKIRKLYNIESHRAKHDILQFTRFVEDALR